MATVRTEQHLFDLMATSRLAFVIMPKTKIKNVLRAQRDRGGNQVSKDCMRAPGFYSQSSALTVAVALRRAAAGSIDFW